MIDRLDEVIGPCMTLVKDQFGLKKDEVFLSVVMSDSDIEVAEIATACARSLGASASILRIVDSDLYNVEPDKAVAAALCNADAIFAMCPIPKTQTIRKALDAGARVLSSSYLRREMLIRCMKADIESILHNCKLFHEKLSKAEVFTMKSDYGTDFAVNIKGHRAYTMTGFARESGTADVIPPAQVGIAPVSGTGEGILVVDGCARPAGVVSNHVTIRVEKGFIKEISGGPEAQLVRKYIEHFGEKQAFACPAHVGPGMNPAAVLNDSLSEAERIEGHITVGIGQNHTIVDGDIKGIGHTDVTLTNADVFLDSEQVIEKGKLVI